jgi:hypothetical protein
MQLTELTQSAVEILKVEVGVVRIVIRCDDIAATVIRQQLAKSQLLHTSLKHHVILLVPKKKTAPLNRDSYLYTRVPFNCNKHFSLFPRRFS